MKNLLSITGKHGDRVFVKIEEIVAMEECGRQKIHLCLSNNSKIEITFDANFNTEWRHVSDNRKEQMWSGVKEYRDQVFTMIASEDAVSISETQFKEFLDDRVADISDAFINVYIAK